MNAKELDAAIAVINAFADPHTVFSVQHQKRRLVMLVKRDGRTVLAQEICTFPEATDEPR